MKQLKLASVLCATSLLLSCQTSPTPSVSTNKVKVKTQINFEQNDTLDDSSKRILDTFVQTTKDFKELSFIQVTGFSKEEDFPWGESVDRAQSVVDYLLEQGMEGDLIKEAVQMSSGSETEAGSVTIEAQGQKAKTFPEQR